MDERKGLNNLTKLEALLLTEEMWLWLSENPGKEKIDWPKWKENGGELDSERYACLCCDYAGWVPYSQTQTSRCSGCPIPDNAWSDLSTETGCPCCEEDTPYSNWVLAEIGEERVLFAKQIATLARSEINKMTLKDWKLCYVENSWAYFTTQELSEQWGDDWDDSSYESNAGQPYEPCWHNEPENLSCEHRGGVKPGELCWCAGCKKDWNKDGTPRWFVAKVAFDGNFIQPCSYTVNSPWSVKDINSGAVAWLRGDEVTIHAGCSLDDFALLIKKGGGDVYLKA